MRRADNYQPSPDSPTYNPPRRDFSNHRGRMWRPSDKDGLPTGRYDRGMKRPLSPPQRILPTVFVTKLAQKVRQEDVEELFQRAGNVRDVRLVTDRMSTQHKGAAYVEFYEREAVAKAIRLSGSVLCGVAVDVRAWAEGGGEDWRGPRHGRGGIAEGEREGGHEDGATVGWSSRPPMHRMDGGIGSSREAEGEWNGWVRHGVNSTRNAPSHMVSIEELKHLLNPNQLAIKPYVNPAVIRAVGDAQNEHGRDGGNAGPVLERVPLPVAAGAVAATRVYVGGLLKAMTTQQLREIFLEFGEVVWCEIEKNAMGISNGVGAVEFSHSASARRALEANGRRLNEKVMRVFLRRSEVGGEVSAEIDAGGEGGVNLNSTRRAMLMQQLSRGETVGGRRLRGDLEKLKTQTDASKALLLANMFNPDVEEEGFENDVTEDVRDECATQYGKVAHVFVEKESHGIVYVLFVDVDAAMRAQASLDGRWFGGNKVSASFVSVEDYVKKFPTGTLTLTL